MNEGKVTAHIRYKDVEQKFTGSAEDVWISVNRLFAEMIPALEVAGKIVLTVNIQDLIDDCKDIVAVAPEGAALLVPRVKLTDNETLCLYLLATHIGHKLGLLDNEGLSKDRLRARLGKTAKIASTRLGELCREGLVVKAEDECYRMTNFGVRKLQKEMLPKIRAKI